MATSSNVTDRMGFWPQVEGTPANPKADFLFEVAATDRSAHA
jgi:hypothetical protein